MKNIIPDTRRITYKIYARHNIKLCKIVSPTICIIYYTYCHSKSKSDFYKNSNKYRNYLSLDIIYSCIARLSAVPCIGIM